MQKHWIIVAAIIFVGLNSAGTANAQPNTVTASEATKTELKAAKQARSRKEYGTALHLYKKLADQNVPEAQCELGEMYSRAIGTPSRLEEGKKMLEKAAAKGNAKAEFLLSQLLADVWSGGKEDESERLLQQAVKNEYAEAEFTLAMRLLSQENSESPDSKGRALMRKAALHGSSEAGNNLGEYCFQHKQYAEGNKWFELSRHGNDGDRDTQNESCKQLACQYYYGWGVKKDSRKAVWYYAQAQPEAMGLAWTLKMAPGAKPSPAEVAAGVRWMLGTFKTNESDLIKVMGLMHRK